MEYVKGEPITAYCDRHRLSTADRLALFIRVCEGVQHAHQKGIIHRDLKPSNVLVALQDGQPVPKIIDFGIAKATAHHLTEQTVFTELGVLIGTPEYMSPEQAEMTGLDIDTRTDVYALGVLLYELLTGTLPFDRKLLREKGLDEIRRAIREVDPPRPSTRVTQQGPSSTEAAKNRLTEPTRLVGQLRGDLDWITMKALEKDRTRRYETAMGLASDVRRHLEHEPVAAGPPSAAYRAKKFVRRHRFGVAAAATLGLLLVAFGATMAAQAQRITRERDRANLEAEAAKRISEFLVSLFEVSEPSEKAANSVSARELLDRGSERIRNELRGQPRLRATLLETLASVYVALGSWSTAAPMADEASRLTREVAGPRSPEAARSLSLVAEITGLRGDYATSERMYREALEIRRATSRLGDREVGSILRGLSIVLRRQAKYQEAESVIREALSADRQAGEASLKSVARDLTTLGALQFATGNYTDAERAFEEAVGLYRQLLGPRNYRTQGTLANLASARALQGRWQEAEPVYREALMNGLEIAPDSVERVNDLNNLGAALFMQRKYAEAETVYRQAADLARRVLGPEHPDASTPVRNLAELFEAQGRYTEARIALEEVLRILRRAFGNNHPEVADALVLLSATHRKVGRLADAESAARQALAIDTKHFGSGHAKTSRAGADLGAALVAQRRWNEAEPLLLAYAAALEAEKSGEGDLGEIVRGIIEMYAGWGKPEKAAEWRKKLPPAK